MAKRLFDIISRIFFIVAIVLGIIAIYQILRYLLGGSWGVEGLVVALLISNISLTVYIARDMSALKTEVKYLRRDIDHIRRDLDRLTQMFYDHTKQRHH